MRLACGHGVCRECVEVQGEVLPKVKAKGLGVCFECAAVFGVERVGGGERWTGSGVVEETSEYRLPASPQPSERGKFAAELEAHMEVGEARSMDLFEEVEVEEDARRDGGERGGGLRTGGWVVRRPQVQVRTPGGQSRMSIAEVSEMTSTRSIGRQYPESVPLSVSQQLVGTVGVERRDRCGRVAREMELGLRCPNPSLAPVWMFRPSNRHLHVMRSSAKTKQGEGGREEERRRDSTRSQERQGGERKGSSAKKRDGGVGVGLGPRQRVAVQRVGGERRRLEGKTESVRSGSGRSREMREVMSRLKDVIPEIRLEKREGAMGWWGGGGVQIGVRKEEEEGGGSGGRGSRTERGREGEQPERRVEVRGSVGRTGTDGDGKKEGRVEQLGKARSGVEMWSGERGVKEREPMRIQFLLRGGVMTSVGGKKKESDRERGMTHEVRELYTAEGESGRGEYISECLRKASLLVRSSRGRGGKRSAVQSGWRQSAGKKEEMGGVRGSVRVEWCGGQGKGGEGGVTKHNRVMSSYSLMGGSLWTGEQSRSMMAQPRMGKEVREMFHHGESVSIESRRKRKGSRESGSSVTRTEEFMRQVEALKAAMGSRRGEEGSGREVSSRALKKGERCGSVESEKGSVRAGEREEKAVEVEVGGSGGKEDNEIRSVVVRRSSLEKNKLSGK